MHISQPLKHPFTALTIASIFVRDVVRLDGIPRSIISDRDKVFMSHFWHELFKLQGTFLHRSIVDHPLTDGQTEVINRCLETYLRCFSSQQPKKWQQWLSWSEYWYNTTFHDFTKTTPFRAVYGRDPLSLICYGTHATGVAAVEQQLRDRDLILDELKYHLQKAQAQMKQVADSHHRDLVFSWVI